LAQNRSSTDQIILPAVTAPSATAIVTVAQVVVIKLDRVQDIGEHAAVMGLVEAGMPPSRAATQKVAFARSVSSARLLFIL
jgi:hypothetical protein